MSVDVFRSGMARLGAAVSLVTTDGAAGRYGIAASAVCSVTDTPPTLLVCINRGSNANARVRANGVLCVNVLGGGHRELCERFSRPGQTSEERFVDTHLWERLQTGSPVLRDAMVAFDCVVENIVEVGSHSVIFASVAAVTSSVDPEALIYLDRQFHAVAGIRA